MCTPVKRRESGSSFERTAGVSSASSGNSSRLLYAVYGRMTFKHCAIRFAFLVQLRANCTNVSLSKKYLFALFLLFSKVEPVHASFQLNFCCTYEFSERRGEGDKSWKIAGTSCAKNRKKCTYLRPYARAIHHDHHQAAARVRGSVRSSFTFHRAVDTSVVHGTTGRRGRCSPAATVASIHERSPISLLS